MLRLRRFFGHFFFGNFESIKAALGALFSVKVAFVFFNFFVACFFI